MAKQVVFDHEQTRKILARRVMIDQRLEEIMAMEICKTQEELRKRLNKELYELAEKQGVSLYDICFNFMPDYEHRLAPEGDFSKYEITITLRPAKLNMEPEDDWIKVGTRQTEVGVPLVLHCPDLEEDDNLCLGHFDGESFYTNDGYHVKPTHYLPVFLPRMDSYETRITIDGIEYEAVDTKIEDGSIPICSECDLFKLSPRHPLCTGTGKAIANCFAQQEKNINRIWKKVKK